MQSISFARHVEAHSERQRGCLTASHTLLPMPDRSVFEEGENSLLQNIADTAPDGYEQAIIPAIKGRILCS